MPMLSFVSVPVRVCPPGPSPSTIQELPITMQLTDLTLRLSELAEKFGSRMVAGNEFSTLKV